MKQSLLMPLALLFSPFIYAQFTLNGSALQTSDRCWTLAPNTKFAVGSGWHQQKVNLNDSFDISLNIFLGCDTSGADGMVFGFQQKADALGYAGGALGFSPLSPSLGIELDTWVNDDIGDPDFRHIAIVKNGGVDHTLPLTLAGPIAFGKIVSDCNYHDMRVRWQPKTKKLDVFWDCILMLSYTGDIVKDIFKGDPSVFWGFTAATGGATNEYKFCLPYNKFLDQLLDTSICLGGRLQLNMPIGSSYKWSPQGDINNISIPNPIISPTKEASYIVTATDKCQRVQFDTFTVKIAKPPFSLNLGYDTTLCANKVLDLKLNIEGAQYTWQDNQTGNNYRISNSGIYRVKAIKDGCIVTDSIIVYFATPPSVFLGNDTILCADKSFKLDAENGNSTYAWQDGSTKSTFDVSASGYYAVKLQNECGTATDEIKITFEDCHSVFIPNSFSPNGDGVNDFFMVYDGGNVKRIKRFEVYNRWGNQVFKIVDAKPNDTQFAWNGDNATMEIYSYFAEIEFTDGKMEVKKGDISIVK